MKVLEDNAGLLTNPEVLAVLKERGADKDAKSSEATASERQAYAALVDRGTPDVSRERVAAFVAALARFNLPRGEVLQLANLAPRSPAAAFWCLNDSIEAERLDFDAVVEEILALVAEHLPEPPKHAGAAP